MTTSLLDLLIQKEKEEYALNALRMVNVKAKKLLQFINEKEAEIKKLENKINLETKKS